VHRLIHCAGSFGNAAGFAQNLVNSLDRSYLQREMERSGKPAKEPIQVLLCVYMCARVCVSVCVCVCECQFIPHRCKDCNLCPPVKVYRAQVWLATLSPPMHAPPQIAKLVDYDSKRNMYFVEYTVQVGAPG
jgi:hypothetical protein